MPRAILIVMDSVGIGGAPDAARFGDAGADTLGHIAEACACGKGDRAGLRQGPLHLPFLAAIGLRQAAEAARGKPLPSLGHDGSARGRWGHAIENAPGKDTPSGHWELAGCLAGKPWRTFPNERPALPKSFTEALIAEARLPGLLGDRHADGVGIVQEMGAQHVRTGEPIIYTSVDSVIQIAAHEAHFGLDRLYEVCRIGRELADPLNVGRVIARPFVGDAANGFTRTPRRKDFSLAPPEPTILDACAAAGRDIVSLGKIGDIFAHRNTGRELKAAGNMALFDALLDAVAGLDDGGFLFANFVDFDTDHGHRRDVAGYADCLEAFDRRLPELDALLRPGDLVVISADHGNDPTWRGSEHTREQVPVLAFGPGIAAGPIGQRESFSDVAASLASHLGIAVPGSGHSFLSVRP